MKQFNSLIELLTKYNTEEKCSRYIAETRWEGKPVCPHCNHSEKIYTFKDGIYFKCSSCRKKFTVKIGTIFEGSNIPLQKWFAAIWLFTSHKKGISSIQLGKDINVTQKTAWFMLHRLRYGMEHPNYKSQLNGTVEADETYMGGSDKNKHKSKLGGQGQGAIGRRTESKTAVFGAIERKGKVFASVVPNVKKEVLQPLIIKNVKKFARLITDEWYAYGGIDNFDFNHNTIKHSVQYVVGDVHTNSIENFWSQLKRGIYGIYHQTSKKHLQKYVEEFCYRFNSRKMSETERFDLLIRQSNVGVMHYWNLTGVKSE